MCTLFAPSALSPHFVLDVLCKAPQGPPCNPPQCRTPRRTPCRTPCRTQATNSSTASEARYSGVLDAVASILRREGLGAFFKVR